jgi:hypothetical protein
VFLKTSINLQWKEIFLLASTIGGTEKRVEK